MAAKHEFVLLGITQQKEVIDWFNIGKRQGETYTQSALIVLNNFGKRPNINWLGLQEIPQTPEEVITLAHEWQYSTGTTNKDYTAALKALASQIETSPPKMKTQHEATLAEIKKWSTDRTSRGF